MSETKKIIKGQAWISGDMLVQDQIIFEADGTVIEKEEVLIEDIWNDSLLRPASQEGPASSSAEVKSIKEYKYITNENTKLSPKKEGDYNPKTTETRPTKCYFYWEYTMTDSEDDTHEIVVRLECPKPTEGLFGNCGPYNPDEYDSEYAKFYVWKLKEADENFENKAAIQKKEIIFPGTQRMNFKTGLVEDVPEFRVNNTDIGDITNLLNLF